MVTLVLLLLGAFAMGRSADSEAAAGPVSPLVQVTVQPGDTLWSVARQLSAQQDPREVVAQLRRLNGLRTASLTVGQQLLLPRAA